MSVAAHIYSTYQPISPGPLCAYHCRYRQVQVEAARSKRAELKLLRAEMEMLETKLDHMQTKQGSALQRAPKMFMGLLRKRCVSGKAMRASNGWLRVVVYSVCVCVCSRRDSFLNSVPVTNGSGAAATNPQRTRSMTPHARRNAKRRLQTLQEQTIFTQTGQMQEEEARLERLLSDSSEAPNNNAIGGPPRRSMEQDFGEDSAAPTNNSLGSVAAAGGLGQWECAEEWTWSTMPWAGVCVFGDRWGEG